MLRKRDPLPTLGCRVPIGMHRLAVVVGFVCRILYHCKPVHRPVQCVPHAVP